MVVFFIWDMLLSFGGMKIFLVVDGGEGLWFSSESAALVGIRPPINIKNT